MRILQFSRLLVEQPKHGQQLLYCTLLLFLYCLHDYCVTLEPGKTSSKVVFGEGHSYSHQQSQIANSIVNELKRKQLTEEFSMFDCHTTVELWMVLELRTCGEYFSHQEELESAQYLSFTKALSVWMSHLQYAVKIANNYLSCI